MTWHGRWAEIEIYNFWIQFLPNALEVNTRKIPKFVSFHFDVQRQPIQSQIDFVLISAISVVAIS